MGSLAFAMVDLVLHARLRRAAERAEYGANAGTGISFAMRARIWDIGWWRTTW
jgi:hypothetical protein